MRRLPVKTLAFVLAGGEGTRLRPLTAECSKPAVPFNGKHRIVDFVLSNLANSGIEPVYMLAQYQAQGLIDYVRAREQLARQHGSVRPKVAVLTPRLHNDSSGFRGTADAIVQNLRLIEDFRPDVVAIFSADHVYRMDVQQMIDEHLARDADVTIATIPVPLAESRSFGILETDDALRVRSFHEKPEMAKPMPGRSTHALASMGNYVFSADVLLEELRQARLNGEIDFGNQVLPRLLGNRRMLAYDFTSNHVPGLASFEEPCYWRDVGTIDALMQAQRETSGRTPKFRIDNPQWPIHGGVPAGNFPRFEAAGAAHEIAQAG